MEQPIYPLVVWLTIVTSRDQQWWESSPSYLLEKSRVLSLDERDAWGFGYLDVENMRRAVEYLRQWRIEIPDSWKAELRLQLQAAEEWAREQKANDQLAA